MKKVLKFLFFYNLLFFILVVSANNNSNNQKQAKTTNYFNNVKIGVVVDLKSPMGKMVNSCIAMAHSEFYSAHSDYRTRLDLRIKDVDSELDQVSAVMQLLENEEVHAIIKLLKSTDSTSIVAALANRAHVPIVSFSGTTLTQMSFSPNNKKTKSYFLQMLPDNRHRARALAATLNEFEWQQAAVLYEEDNNNNNDFISHLHKAFQDNNNNNNSLIRISHMVSFPTSIDDSTLETELRKLLAIQCRIFLVHVGASLGYRIFPLAKKIGLMGKGHGWVITDVLANDLDSMDIITVIESMEGVIGIKRYVPKSRNLQGFERRWTRHIISMFPDGDDDKVAKLNVYGVLAYDAFSALAMAAEKMGRDGQNGSDSHYKKNQVNDVANFWVSNLGSNLFREFSRMKFKGLGGDFELANGQLKVAFEIFNIFGSGEKKIGKWDPKKGITQKLGSVMWPGDSTTIPLDWGFDKLRILVPMKQGFPEFVSVPHCSQHKPTGLSMDIFYAAVELLPFQVDYEISFYPIKYGNVTRSYDDLLHMISEDKYDCAIADITIMDDRAPKLEYTHPYIASEIVMLVRNVKRKDIWILFKVFKWELWTMIIVTYFSVGFVVRILQHQSNGLLFWFPLAVLALPESNMVVNRWTAFVLVVSFAMGSIIIQCYLGKYSAMVLSDQQEYVFSKDSMVGIQEASFLKDYLIKKLNFNESRLKAFSSIEEFHDAMTRGGKNGGIDIIMDESPYVNLMLRKYGSAYKTVGPTYKTGGGFAFVFNEGLSQLAHHFSRAIIKVIQSDRMAGIEQRNLGFGYSSTKPETTGDNNDNNGLDPYNFGGPILVIVSANILALFFSETSVGQRLSSSTKRVSQRGYSTIAYALVEVFDKARYCCGECLRFLWEIRSKVGSFIPTNLIASSTTELAVVTTET